jgi:hypothetical protein
VPEENNVDQLIQSPASQGALIRFEDATDANTPRLNYSVPLPGAFSAKLYIETDFLNDELPWKPAAREDRRRSVVINEFMANRAAGGTPPIPELSGIATVPKAAAPRRAQPPAGIIALSAASGQAAEAETLPGDRDRLTRITALAAPGNRQQPAATHLAVQFDNLVVDFEQIAAEAKLGRAPVFYRRGGIPMLTFVQEAPSDEAANPRFVIVEHYRLSSLFGDYGAGKTLAVFSLMPGEETTIYVRSWRRSETTLKQASSIFDSHTEEAAFEFETDLLAETTDKSNASSNNKMYSEYSGSGEINLGLLKTKHSGKTSDELQLQTARETASKNVAKVTSNHASKASSKREIEVTQEIQQTEAQEFETITERKIKNTNLSRTLNVVTRELNQEFTTYFSLVDVSLAFVNDLGVFELFQIHEIDRMLSKYLPEPAGPAEGATPSPFGNVSPYNFVRQRLIQQINEVYDFQGTRHEFLEEVSLTGDGEDVFRVGEAPANTDTYLRVRRSRRTDEPNPFYDPGYVPVDGIVMVESRNTVRTVAAIIDLLLGHGVGLDNYALGMQQEALRRDQLENMKTELALRLIEEGNEAQLEAFRSLFGSVDNQLLRQVAVPESGGD